MLALITGASSGLGKEIASELSGQGYDLIVVARRKERLEELKSILHTNVKVITADLSSESACYSLWDEVKHEPIDVLVNNAGFGLCGEFAEIDIQRETEMVRLNISALHILTKLFLQKFTEENHGTILNIASCAAFFPGAYMTTYYATKSYVLRLTRGVREELRRQKSRVKICAFCPGPIKTEFDAVANVRTSLCGLNARKAAKIAVCGIIKGKAVIVPGIGMKITRIFSKIIPDFILLQITATIQKRKMRSKKHDY